MGIRGFTLHENLLQINCVLSLYIMDLQLFYVMRIECSTKMKRVMKCWIFLLLLAIISIS